MCRLSQLLESEQQAVLVVRGKQLSLSLRGRMVVVRRKTGTKPGLHGSSANGALTTKAAI